jgi:hypothetical protein
MNTKIINLYGGPSTGKSTSAAYLFYRLKHEGKNVELVREYIKSWAWEKREINHYDQFYFFGKQSRQESMLYGKVDYIVTDCPVMMGSYYGSIYCPETVATGVKLATQAFYSQAAQDGNQHYHVFLNRTKAYNPAGRFQTEEQAKGMDPEIKLYLMSMNLPLIECGTDEESLKSLLEQIG